MVVLTKLKRNTYRDSVFLMRIASTVGEIEGVSNVAAVIGTDENKKSLKDAKMFTGEIKEATANDLMLAVDARTESIAQDVLSKVEEMLTARPSASEALPTVSTLTSAVDIQPDSNWILLSIPGQFVRREALRAIRANLNLMIFSSNVPIADEVEIKTLAKERGLLVMGPDCGTAIIGGIGMAFANKVRKGPIGVVGASGTGIQEVVSIVHKQGSGLTHAIGTGTNDVSAQVGGITMLSGIRLLDQDLETKVIVVVSKSPSIEVQTKIIEAARRCHKPVIIDFLGGQVPKEVPKGLLFARTLEEAALQAVALAEVKPAFADPFSKDLESHRETARSEYSKLGSKQKYVRGLFAGGTFCNEACGILLDLGLDVRTNTRFPTAKKLRDTGRSEGHTVLDMGAEEFTAGRPHPMIEPFMRESRLLQEARDPSTAVILLDFILGYGSHDDPAGAFIDALRQAKNIARKKERYLPMVASVCGTQDDPQELSQQINKLKKADVIVMPSNAQAAKMAALIAKRGAF